MTRLAALRQRLHQATWLLLVTLFGLPLITPLLQWTAGPCTHDGHLHYHRIAAMRHAWESGLPISRWLPDLAFGYGYPFFVYREGPPLYASLIPHLLGIPLPAAINLFYVLAILASGWFTFLWVRDLFGERAGLVAAVAYMAAPYTLIDALVRGNQPESMALPLLPLLCWAGRRFVMQGSRLPFLLSTFGLALLALSHNISLLLFTPFLLVYLAAVAFIHHLSWRTALLRLLLIFGLGLGLTTFYIGTALVELNEITISQSTSTRNNNFRFNFTAFSEIFAPVAPEDPALLNPPLPIRLGWLPSALALFGTLIGLLKTGIQGNLPSQGREQELRGTQEITKSPISNLQSTNPLIHAVSSGREQQWHIILMAMAAAVYLFMSLPLSQPLWEHLPLIRFVQFPWRLIGRAALPVAFLAGVPFAVSGVKYQVSSAKSHVSRFTFHALFFVAITLLLLEALPTLYPFNCSEKPFPTINEVHVYEHNTGLVGVDPEGSYFPKTVQQRPAGSSLEADYQAGLQPQRFDPAALPAGATIETARYQPTSAVITLHTPDAFTARYRTFAFPGWQALVDGRPVPITASDPEGLITFPVPAGRHTVAVRWQSTPLRTALGFISLLSLAATLATTLVLPGYLPSPFKGEGVGERVVWPVFIVALLLLALKLFIVDQGSTPFRRESTPPVHYPLALTGAELQLAGYNLNQASVPAGHTFTVDLAWRTLAPPQADYQSSLALVGPDGLAWSEKETYRSRTYEDVAATRLWLPGQWAWDSREVQVLAGTPPGRYDLVLTLFDLATLQPLTLRDTAGNVIGPSAVIGQVAVTSPPAPPTFQPQFPLTQSLDGLQLLGYSQDRAEAAPGDPFLLTLFWQKEATNTTTSDALPLELRDEDGRPAHTWPIPPVLADYPPAVWQPGERLRGQHALRLPAALASGRYQFWLAGTPLGAVTVNAPTRTFTEPSYDHPLPANFNDQLHLIGYTLHAPISNLQSPITLTLVWQGTAEMTTSYHIFVHAVDENGQLLAQSDGEPAGWTRPTTGWAVSEYVIDEHYLPTPPGVAALRVGVYDPDSGRRLPTGDTDYVGLPFP
jgi:hypothetical protein